jgi:prepilin signal peptidase PulO-like enzyme (type II secretory pathway)
MSSGVVTSHPPAVSEGERPYLGRALICALVVVLATLAFASFGVGRALVVTGLAGVLVVLSTIDLERRVIPNRIVLPATVLLLLAQLALFPGRAPEWMLAPLAVGLVMVIPTLLGRSWMGMGDVKLAMLIAIGLGWASIGALLVAFACVFPVALAILIRGGLAARKATIPFGPFLALGALIVLFAPQVTG